MSQRRGKRAPSVCGEPGCPEFTTYRGRCQAHQRKPTGTGERGSTWAGRKVRQRVLKRARDGKGVPRCFYCTAPATIADHYIPLAHDGVDTEENIVAACARCNAVKSDQMPDDFLASTWLADRRQEVASQLSQ
jgi:5-methylcytosine-specific restriction endonuclease McrA